MNEYVTHEKELVVVGMKDMNERVNLEENLEDVGNDKLEEEENEPTKGVDYYSQCLVYNEPKRRH